MLKLTGSVIHDWGTNTHTSHEDLQYLLELTPKKDVIFIIGDWNEKIGSRRISGITGKFGLGVQNEAKQRLTEFCRENTLVIANFFPVTQETTLYMEITKLLILKSDWLYSLQLKMEKLYIIGRNKTKSWLWLRSQNSLLPNSVLNWRK